MSGVQKFMFDTQFDAPPPPPPEPEVAEIVEELPPEPPAPTFSEAELEDAKKRAWDDALAEGLRQGRAEALGGVEQVHVKLLETMTHKLADLLTEQAARFAQQREMTLRIALTIARKLMPAYAERHGLAEIEAAVTGMLGELGEEPRLVVRVADSQLDAVTIKIQREVDRRGFAGKVIFMGDPAMGPSDCLIEWADGGAGRDEQRLWGEIDRVAAQAIQSGPGMPSPKAQTAAPVSGTTSTGEQA